jgi:hypothetical protein
MAPEQRRRRPVDARADVYSLGRVLEHLLGDRSGALRRVVERATAAEPGARYPSVRALIADFDARVRAGRRTTIAALGAATAAGLAVLVAVAVGPPRGERAAYPEAVWGADLLPAGVWNVARDAAGRRGIRLRASHPGFACGQSLSELVDGLTEYHDWKHGFAFPPPPPGFCVSFGLLGPCGVRDPGAHLCERSEGGGVRLDALVGSATTPPGEAFGQWTEGVPCGERWIEVALDRPRPVQALRVWHHGPENVPTRQRVEVEAPGGWRAVYRTTERPSGIGDAWGPRRAGYHSGPLTLDFPPVTAERVRWVMDSCSTPSGGHGWVYELEVFAAVPRLEALYRRFSRE